MPETGGVRHYSSSSLQHHSILRGVSGIYLSPSIDFAMREERWAALPSCYLSQVSEFRDELLARLDGYLLHAKTTCELLGALCTFFTICRQYNFKLDALKCELFVKQLIWCGRKITKEGDTFEPRHFDGLLTIPKPTTAGFLLNLPCC